MNNARNPSARSMRLMAHAKGFTLIELMITVAVIAILASIAYPSYQEHLSRTRRADAKTILMTLSSRMERCFIEYNAYNHANCPLQNNSTVNSAEGYYTVTAMVSSATTFSLTAAPQGVQASDKCGSFVLNQAGTKGLTGQATGITVSDCWDR